MKLSLADLLDRLAERASLGQFGPLPAEWDADGDPVAAALLYALHGRHLRPEHRRRIHEDIVRHRDLIGEHRDPHIADLAVWSEHVEALYVGLKKGKVGTFHYTRALEATCRRCGFELLPLMARMEDLGHHWGARNLARTYEMVSPHLEQPDAPGETALELGA